MAMTAPATPRASTLRQRAAEVEQDHEIWDDIDGRSTPVPGSNSSSDRTNTSSPPSTMPPLSPSDSPAPKPEMVTGAGPSTGPVLTRATAPPGPPGGAAEYGFGNAPAETGLKQALQSKDRIFVVMLSKEMEAFIARVQAGETPAESSGQGALSIIGANVRMQSQATSKFQRMLVYRVAEWYGIKAVSAPDGALFVGVQGTLDPKSATLRLAELVPETKSVQPTFQIMQRRAAQPTTDAPGEGGPTSRKTLEQREAEYALARERIFQQEAPAPPPTAQPPKKSFEPVFASLHHPPKPDRQRAFETGYYEEMPYPAYTPVYPGYQHQPYPVYDGMAYGWQPPTAPGTMQQWGYPMMQQQLMPPQQMSMAPQQMPMAPQQMSMQPQMSMPPQQMPLQQMPPQTMPPMTNGMSAVPQQYPSYNYPTLQHPQPQRPNAQPHSSASSSISSRSYQDYSRPHSRGSTTSTKSATSSVRMGPMYPAQSYRQKGMKLTNLRGRGHSPVSHKSKPAKQSSTTSSRSSRQASTTVANPGQAVHPLPQRPDWAATTNQHLVSAAHSNGAEFIPLHLQQGTEPAQPGRVNTVPHSHPHPHPHQHQQPHPHASSLPALPVDGYTNGVPPAIPLSSDDPDFPRRTPIRAQLFDPSSKTSRPPSAAPGASGSAVPIVTPDMSPEDVIEAKLQALSVSTGVSIGPPPVRNGASGASYAKAVRRD